MPPVAPTTPMQSVDRALETLELLAEHGESGVTEVAERLGVHKSTASRLLGALEARRMVEQSGDRGRYRLGGGVLALAGALAGQLDLVRAAHGVCEALAEEVGETVNVAIPDDGDVVNVDQARGSSAVSTHNWTGERTPAHATSSGKVLLAFGALPRPAGRGRLPRYTDRTVTDRRALAAQLDEVAGRGFAVADGELEEGLLAIAAPVRDAGGTVVAAISASGPGYRLGQGRREEVAAALVAAAEEVSKRLGWRGGADGQPPDGRRPDEQHHRDAGAA